MPDHEHQDDPTYFERIDTLTQFDDFVADVINANMFPPAHQEEYEDDAESSAG
jgi:hypothetical protein